MEMPTTGLSVLRPELEQAPARFNCKQFFPAGAESCTDEFVSLFHLYAYIYKQRSGGTWLSASNEKWQLSKSEMLKAIAGVHPKYIYGCRAGKTSRFAVLDIDAGSMYHNLKSLSRIRQCLADAGLKSTVLYRSSLSDGWHLYLFFDEPVSSRELRKQISLLLKLNDFQIEKGQLEVFPAPGDGPGSLGHGLRLPLQPGFAWLDPYDLEVIRDRLQLTAVKALELFLQDLHDAPNTRHDFERLKRSVEAMAAGKEQLLLRSSTSQRCVIPIRSELKQQSEALVAQVEIVFAVLPPGMDAAIWLKGRLYHLQGLTGPSQRADAIFCLNHYLFYGDPSRELPALGYGYAKERRWSIERMLNWGHNGYSKDIARGRPDALAQIERAAEWLPPERRDSTPLKYQPAVVPLVWVRANENRRHDARARIQSALDTLKKLQRPFTTIELQKAAGCSRETLYHHQDLWRDVYEDRKNYTDLASGFFAGCTGQYNGVVVDASVSTRKPPSAEVLRPPGLIACRQVSFELSMRSKREERSRDKRKNLEDIAMRYLVRAALSEVQPSSTELAKMRAVLSLVIFYLLTAPTEEDAIVLQEKIALVKTRIKSGFGTQLRLVNKPPPED
jgi:hypothetical protein